MQRFFFSILLLAFMGNLVVPQKARATLNSNLSKNNLKVNSSLTVNIDGLKNQNGQVCLSLFSSSQGFPSDGDRALQVKCVALEEGTPAITFENLKPGSYGVAAFHDINDDGVFNLNGLGIPKEGFGFSRDPKIFTGPPKFGDVIVIIVGPKNNIRIKLQYLLARASRSLTP
ncbi:MAG: DUF2141 domain-containing protein [Okeania sp. SIO2D1]|nr:DUF2141 domain-containing protein [Okeania sp. SIO2D1]